MSWQGWATVSHAFTDVSEGIWMPLTWLSYTIDHGTEWRSDAFCHMLSGNGKENSMARDKGMGSLQLEKSGRWTLRVGIGGKRFSRSTGTKDRAAAERFAQRFLAPLGLGERRLPLSEVWFEYERSPKRRDLASTTLLSKRQVWMQFARWMERRHLEVTDLAQLTADMVGEYLQCVRIERSATTYNNHVCVLREICRTLQDKAGVTDDPWEGVRLMADDAHARREFSLDELERILKAAKGSAPFDVLFLIGIYTGLRLGDCCMLEWSGVNLERKVIQVIPRKTRKHAHGRPVTIPIHPVLFLALQTLQAVQTSQVYVLPQMAAWYQGEKWRVSEGLRRIFRAANIVTSVRIVGRRYRAPEATFHSLRHTFVSLAANAGVPLPVVQSIVGHTSTAMTRHYYHENESELWRAVSSIPTLGAETKAKEVGPRAEAPSRAKRVCERLKDLDDLLSLRLISDAEYKAARQRILCEI